MKYFHKMVTPPPRTAFMKSLFRCCHWFWGIYYFWIRDMKSDWTPAPFVKLFHKIPVFFERWLPLNGHDSSQAWTFIISTSPLQLTHSALYTSCTWVRPCSFVTLREAGVYIAFITTISEKEIRQDLRNALRIWEIYTYFSWVRLVPRPPGLTPF